MTKHEVLTVWRLIKEYVPEDELGEDEVACIGALEDLL